MERLYWWKGMREDVRQHIRNCSELQKNKTNQKPCGLLQPSQIPGRRWESISADLITQLSMTKSGNTKIVVFVDRFSKMVHFAAVPTAFSAYDIARLYMHTRNCYLSGLVHTSTQYSWPYGISHGFASGTQNP